MKSQKLKLITNNLKAIPNGDPKTSVKKLISKLKIMYYNQDQMLEGIENFQNLYSALCDLDEIVGMYDIKKSIVDQIKFLLVNYTGGKSKFEGNMLNTLISGNPGTGKTSVGICLSNIWNALGLLKKETLESKQEKTNGFKPINKARRNTIAVKTIEPKEGEGEQPKSKFDDIFLMALIELMSERNKDKNEKNDSDKKYDKKYDDKNENKYGDKDCTENKIKPNDQLLIKYIKPTKNEDTNNSIKESLDTIKESDSNIGDKLRHKKYENIGINNIRKTLDIKKVDSFKKLERVKFNDDCIKIVSRVDFVAGYVGQSSPKTRELLLEALKEAKVVFIDEAYSLILDDKDPFGLEVLTELNRFMSENPSLVCIFAGYKEKMESTIFRNQPGLKRRIAWTFDIKKYTGDMLTSIYIKQLAKENWKYEGDTKILDKFFEDNFSHFSAFGGDTLTMCFYSKLVYSELKFDFGEYKDLPNKTITYDIFMSAYENMYCTNRPKPEINMSFQSMYC